MSAQLTSAGIEGEKRPLGGLGLGLLNLIDPQRRLIARRERQKYSLYCV